VKYGLHHFEDSRVFERETEKQFLSSITEKDLGRKFNLNFGREFKDVVSVFILTTKMPNVKCHTNKKSFRVLVC